jgi:hypothetical protein
LIEGVATRDAGEDRFEFEIQREFGLSHSDFFRIFPRIEPDSRPIGERGVELERDDGRRLRIELSEEKRRCLGALKIPFIDITFCFAGWTTEQRTEFFGIFERAFQKGGG